MTSSCIRSRRMDRSAVNRTAECSLAWTVVCATVVCRRAANKRASWESGNSNLTYCRYQNCLADSCSILSPSTASSQRKGRYYPSCRSTFRLHRSFRNRSGRSLLRQRTGFHREKIPHLELRGSRLGTGIRCWGTSMVFVVPAETKGRYPSDPSRFPHTRS
jgi:hypothetical protein